MRTIYNVGDIVLIRAKVTHISIDDTAKITYLVRPIDGVDAQGYETDSFFVDEKHVLYVIKEGGLVEDARL